MEKGPEIRPNTRVLSQTKMSGGFECYEDVLDANIVETVSKLSDARDIDASPSNMSDALSASDEVLVVANQHLRTASWPHSPHRGRCDLTGGNAVESTGGVRLSANRRLCIRLKPPLTLPCA